MMMGLSIYGVAVISGSLDSTVCIYIWYHLLRNHISHKNYGTSLCVNK